MSKLLAIARVVIRETLRRKDLYVLAVLLAAALFYLMSLNAFGISGAVRYVKDTGLLLAWIGSWLLTIGLTARQIPQEEQRGSIYSLLAKPITRLEFILGKWAGSFLAATTGTLMLYATVTGVVVLRGSGFQWIPLLQAFALHAALLGILAALSIAFSTRLHADAAAVLSVVSGLTAFIVVPRIPEMLAFAGPAERNFLLVLYYLLPHFELFDMRNRVAHEWGGMPWPAFSGVMLYGILWTALLLLIAWMKYRRKRFNREMVG